MYYLLFVSEFIRSYPKPLSSDAFSTFGAHLRQVHDNEVTDATHHLYTHTFSAFTVWLLTQRQYFPHTYPNTFVLSDLLHMNGINVRHLYAILVHISFYHAVKHSDAAAVRNIHTHTHTFQELHKKTTELRKAKTVPAVLTRQQIRYMAQMEKQRQQQPHSAKEKGRMADYRHKYKWAKPNSSSATDNYAYNPLQCMCEGWMNVFLVEMFCRVVKAFIRRRLRIIRSENSQYGEVINIIYTALILLYICNNIYY